VAKKNLNGKEGIKTPTTKSGSLGKKKGNYHFGGGEGRENRREKRKR